MLSQSVPRFHKPGLLAGLLFSDSCLARRKVIILRQTVEGARRQSKLRLGPHAQNPERGSHNNTKKASRNTEGVSRCVRRAREASADSDYPVDEMALLLGITRDTYTKYEGRGASLMPHNLIVPFCLACRVSVEWLLTGMGPPRSRS